jgi:hypothetical protein
VNGISEIPDSDMTGTMKVACCVCQREIGTKPCLARFDGEVSHGICPECLKVARANIRRARPVLLPVGGC